MQRPGGGIRKGLVYLVVLVALVGATGVLAIAMAPVLAPRIAPMVAERLGLDHLEVEVGRPGWRGVDLVRLVAVTGRVTVEARGGRVGYRVAELLGGRIDTVVFEATTLVVAAEPVDAAADPAPAPVLPPLPLDGFADDLPVGRVAIDRLVLEVPALGFAGAGRFELAPGRFELRLDGQSPANAAGLALFATGNLNDHLQFIVSEQSQHDGASGAGAGSSVTLDARRGPATLDLAAEVRLSGFAFELAAALAGLPRGSGALTTTAVSSLPWPLPARIDWHGLDLTGELALTWQPAVGAVTLGPLESRWRLHAGELIANVGGTLAEGGSELRLEAATPGLRLGPDGPSGGLTLRVGTPRNALLDLVARMTDGQVAIEATGALDARNWARLGRWIDLPPVRATGRYTIDAGWPWAGAILPGLDSVQADVRVRAARVADLPTLDALEIDDARIRLRGASLTGTVNGQASIGEDSLRLQVSANMADVRARPIQLDGAAGSGPFESVAWRLNYDPARGAGRFVFSGAETVEARLLAAVFPARATTWDLDGGRLDFTGSFGWSEAPGVRGALRIRLDDGSAFYDTYRLSGIATDLAVEIDPTGWRVPATEVRARALDAGIALGDLEARIAIEPDRVLVDRMAATVFGGALAVEPFEYHVESGSAALPVTLRGVDLERVLALYGAQITGTGTLDAVLPARLEAGAISIADGTVTARPPGGVIHLAPGIAQGAGQPGLDFALRALANFTYSRLTAAVDYTAAGDLTLAVTLQGRNPEIEAGRPIHYNLTVTENIPQLIESLSLQDRVVEGLERRLND